MLCEACRELDASVHLTQAVEGEVRQRHLCAKCAAEQGIETTVTAPPKNVLGEFLQAVQQQAGATASDSTRCTYCAMTLRDFRSTGRLGCSRCYATFEPSLRELLRRVQGSAKHVGRRYVPPEPEVLERATTIGELRDRLRRAVENEDFEVAATLRDKIRDVE
ncbi:MAG: UvrB/UvrC motif-containing protein [Gemmatimonadaceae bacterium]|nr:UvrB/UvrC motif-containing protein [Gemmatimonadaceae bacterium]